MQAPPGADAHGEPSDGRLRRGRRTRAGILARAVDIASAEGLDGISLARLGTDLGISKSGVSGHFTSREHLQLAVIDVAAQLYTARVAVAAEDAPEGLAQVWRFCEAWIEFMRSGELAGRSFFLTALVEYDARPGAVHDQLLRLRLRWEDLFVSFWTVAERLTQVHAGSGSGSGADPHQLFYEIASLIAGATLDAQLRDDPTAFDRARTAVLTRLHPLAVDARVLPNS